MGSFRSIAAVGRSIERLLQRGFDQEDPAGGGTTATLVQTDDFAADSDAIGMPALSIFLYRVDIDRTTRSTWSAAGHYGGAGQVAVNLHYLLTPWALNADHAHRILGHAIAQLEANPILAGPTLDPLGDFAPNEEVQLVSGEITTEEIMRTFDSLPTDYRLSMPYLARVVRIESAPARPDTPATVVEVGGRPSVEEG